MKKIAILSLFAVLAFDSFSQNLVQSNELVNQNGIYRMREGKEPFTGASYQLNHKGDTIMYKEYLDGKQHGVDIFFYNNKQKKTEKHFQNGKLHGKFTEWTVMGKLSKEIDYVDGKMHGKEIRYYGHGKKQLEYTYDIEEYHGPMKTWYNSGQLKHESNWKNGKLHGKFVSYDEEGEVTYEAEYNEGQAVQK